MTTPLNNLPLLKVDAAHPPVPIEVRDDHLGKLAQFLANVAEAWDEANQDQRNRLARCLFQEVWIEEKQIVAVKPQPEMKPFFDLNFEAMQERLSRNFGKWRPRWGSGWHAISGGWFVSTKCA